MLSLSTRWRLGVLRPFAFAVSAAIAGSACQSQELQEGLAPPTQTAAEPDSSGIAVTESEASYWYMAIDVTPSQVTVAPGQTVTFKALNWKAGVSAPFPYPLAWSAKGGTITSTGVYTAGNVPGTYQVVAAGTTTQYWDDATVTITGTAATVTRLDLTPATVSLGFGASRQLTASATLSDGTTQSNPSVQWSATGGTVSSSGLYTAGSTAGAFRVIAISTNGKADTTAVTVTATTTTITGVTLTPSTASVTSGQTRQFSVSATLSNGGTQSNPAVTWTATGGTISNAGLYAAGSTAGNYRVIASSTNGKADTSAVAVTAVAATITGITLTPATVSVTTGSARQFAVSATMSNGTTQANPAVTWAATGGTISSAGLYTASGTAGSFRVIATTTNSKADTSTVTVTGSTTPPPSGGGSALFASDWRSGDPLDGGKWARWGNNGILAVVPAAGLGFPPAMANVLQVRMGSSAYDWVQATNKWTLPAIGESRAFRLYFRNAVPTSTTSWANTHPVESKGTLGSISGNFYALHVGSAGTDGYFSFATTAAWPRDNWTMPNWTSSNIGTLPKATYRLEWKWTRVSATGYTLDLRLTDASGAIIADRNTFRAWGGGTLASYGASPFTLDDWAVTGLRIGSNGGFSLSGAPYVYWGGFAVCSDWCGAY